MASYHRPRIGATLLAALFASGTAYVLFEDVLRHGAEITTAHVQTLLALVGTIAAGCYIKPEWHAARRLSALGCALLFAAGTTYIVTASGARNAEVAQAKADAIADTNSKLAGEQRLLARAQAMADETSAKLQAECVKGRASKGTCDGLRTTLAVYTAAVKGHQATLAELGHARTPNAGYRHAAQVFAALPGVTATAEDLARRLELLLPFLVVLITEAGMIIFSHMAFAGHRERPSPSDTAQTSFPLPVRGEPLPPLPPVPPRPGRRANPRGETVKRFVEAYRAKHGRDPEPREVRLATGLPRATAHRWQRKVA